VTAARAWVGRESGAEAGVFVFDMSVLWAGRLGRMRADGCLDARNREPIIRTTVFPCCDNTDCGNTVDGACQLVRGNPVRLMRDE
jgi:hypothetical protein